MINYFQALSLPLVVIVHDNQKTNAWATITWDNAFASPQRLPFIVPNTVAWVNVGQMLSRKFAEAVGCHLDSNDLRFLASKAFGDSNIWDYESRSLSWSQFAKEPLPSMTFTFWEWFYSLVVLTRKNLKDYWSSNTRLIRGFINRQDCEYELMRKSNGTFLLRFSETNLGGLSFACKINNKIINLEPLTSQDFITRSLADRINDLKPLEYLFPNIPKHKAFGKFYSSLKETKPPQGYLKMILVNKLPG